MQRPHPATDENLLISNDADLVAEGSVIWQRKQQAARDISVRIAREEEYCRYYSPLRDEILLMQGRRTNEHFHGRVYDAAQDLPQLAEVLVQYFRMLRKPEYMAKLESVGASAASQLDEANDNSRLALVCLKYTLRLLRAGGAGASKEQVQRKLCEVNAREQLVGVWRWIIQLAYELGPENRTLAVGSGQSSSSSKTEELKPVWDKLNRVLTYDGRDLRRYADPAEAQIGILDTFQELNWSSVVDSPFPNTQKGKNRLRNAMKNLNDGLEQKGVMEFYGDGSGTHVCWRGL